LVYNWWTIFSWRLGIRNKHAKRITSRPFWPWHGIARQNPSRKIQATGGESRQPQPRKALARSRKSDQCGALSQKRNQGLNCRAVDAMGAVGADSQAGVSSISWWQGHRKHRPELADAPANRRLGSFSQSKPAPAFDQVEGKTLGWKRLSDFFNLRVFVSTRRCCGKLLLRRDDVFVVPPREQEKKLWGRSWGSRPSGKGHTRKFGWHPWLKKVSTGKVGTAKLL